MSSRADRLADILDGFLGEAPEIQAAAVVSVDGLPMASALPPEVEEERLAAMSAALHTLGERAASGLGKGGLEQVFVEAEDGYVVLMAAGEGAVLVAVADRDAKPGLVIFEMRKAAHRVAGVLGGQGSFREGSLREVRDVPAVPRAPGDQGFETVETLEEDAAPVLDPFATPTEPFLAPPPPPPDDEEDDHAISSWH
ncbi:MAG: roadblock/LC7 domain-containing protein [Actinobacteria bacterium]|nr:roadblock/LC7 domain-containing protein [Actinomycetota bacterium]